MTSFQLRKVQWRNENGTLLERVDSLHATVVSGSADPRVHLHLGAVYRQIPDEPVEAPAASLSKRQSAWSNYP